MKSPEPFDVGGDRHPGAVKRYSKSLLSRLIPILAERMIYFLPAIDSFR